MPGLADPLDGRPDARRGRKQLVKQLRIRVIGVQGLSGFSDSEAVRVRLEGDRELAGGVDDAEGPPAVEDVEQQTGRRARRASPRAARGGRARAGRRGASGSGA